LNPSTKVFAILSLAAALGQIIEKSTGTEAMHWRGQKLQEAGFEAVGKYPFPPLSNSKVRQIGKKIEEVCCGENISIIETLSFLICGLIDIRAKTNQANWKHIDPVLKRATWCMELFDPRYEMEEIHANAFEQFERWAA
jgi:hypothetical protein